MKKFLAAILGICMLGAMCLAGCNNEDGPGPDPTPGGDTTLEVTGDEIQNDNASFEYIFNDLYNPNTLVGKRLRDGFGYQGRKIFHQRQLCEVVHEDRIAAGYPPRAL